MVLAVLELVPKEQSGEEEKSNIHPDMKHEISRLFRGSEASAINIEPLGRCH